MKEHVTESTQCKSCGYVTDRATNTEIGDGGPKKGAISICLNCGQIAFYEEDLSLTPATDEQLAEIEKNYPLDYGQMMVWSDKFKERGLLHPRKPVE